MSLMQPVKELMLRTMHDTPANSGTKEVAYDSISPTNKEDFSSTLQQAQLSYGKKTLPLHMNILEDHKHGESPRLNQPHQLRLNECSAPVIQKYEMPEESDH